MPGVGVGWFGDGASPSSTGCSAAQDARVARSRPGGATRNRAGDASFSVRGAVPCGTEFGRGCRPSRGLRPSRTRLGLGGKVPWSANPGSSILGEARGGPSQGGHTSHGAPDASGKLHVLDHCRSRGVRDGEGCHGQILTRRLLGLASGPHAPPPPRLAGMESAGSGRAGPGPRRAPPATH